MTRLLPLIVFLCLAIATAFLWFTAPEPTPAPEISKPAIGGPFTLTDQSGQSFTEADLLSKRSLIFFGFTHCPDICPTTLSTLRDALELLGAQAKRYQVIFITIDPARDTQEFLREYLTNFPGVTGLTGTAAQIAQAAGAYKVYYAQQGDMFDHSGFIYLMDEKGDYLAHFPYNIAPEELAEKLKQ